MPIGIASVRRGRCTMIFFVETLLFRGAIHAVTVIPSYNRQYDRQYIKYVIKCAKQVPK